MNEKNGAIRDASVLGVPKMLILGLQHMFAMFGATILVPILVNSYFGEDVLHVHSKTALRLLSFTWIKTFNLIIIRIIKLRNV